MIEERDETIAKLREALGWISTLSGETCVHAGHTLDEIYAVAEAALKKQDITINALGIAMQEKGLMSREMVHKYLSGRNDISTARASELMRYLKAT